MNLLDLAFYYEIDIHNDGDFDGGYYVTMKYIQPTPSLLSDTEEKLWVKQEDIDRLYDGAKKLVGLLEKHASKGY